MRPERHERRFPPPLRILHIRQALPAEHSSDASTESASAVLASPRSLDLPCANLVSWFARSSCEITNRKEPPQLYTASLPPLPCLSVIFAQTNLCSNKKRALTLPRQAPAAVLIDNRPVRIWISPPSASKRFFNGQGQIAQHRAAPVAVNCAAKTRKIPKAYTKQSRADHRPPLSWLRMSRRRMPYDSSAIMRLASSASES